MPTAFRVLTLTGLFICLALAGPAAAPCAENAPAGTVSIVATVGCLDGDADSLRFEDRSGVYRLTGNTDPLTPYIGKEVELRGTLLSRWLPTPGRAIEVISGSGVAAAPAALDTTLGDPAHWRSRIDHQYGVSIAFPGENGSPPILRPHLPARDQVATVHRSVIPRALFPHSDFTGGYFAVFADPDVTDADRCAAASPQSGAAAPARSNTLTIRGEDYNSHRYTMSAAGSIYRSEYLRTFHNGICYEFAFLFGTIDPERSGRLGCMLRPADPSRLASLMVSEVSFFPPQMHHLASLEKRAR